MEIDSPNPEVNTLEIITTMEASEDSTTTISTSPNPRHITSLKRKMMREPHSEDAGSSSSSDHITKNSQYVKLQRASAKKTNDEEESGKRRFSEFPDRIIHLLKNKYTLEHLAPFEIHIERIVNTDKSLEHVTMTEGVAAIG
jgi:hypothetical protein